MNQPPYFTNDDHALRTGMLVGTLMKAGIDAYLSVDDDGNFLNEIVVNLESDVVDPIKVRISVLPPI